MKTKNYLILLSLLCATSLPGLSADYSITFIGSGAAETVESVDVFNVNTGETKTVQGGGTLVLTPTPEGIEQIGNENGNLRVFGADGKTIVTFQAKQQGDAVVEVFGLDGKKMTGLKQNVSAGENTFDLSLPMGAYVVSVTGKGYAYHTKYFERNNTQVAPAVSYVGKTAKKPVRVQEAPEAVAGTVAMLYNEGDRIIYTGHSGNCSTIVTDVPVSDSEMEFYFVECTDGSGNHYKVVQIGFQIWMAENLKTTKYNDGTDIQLGNSETWSGLSTPAYVVAKEKTYYNWFAASSEKIAPAGGWRIPTVADWDELQGTVEILISGQEQTIASALASTYGWSYKETSNLYTAGDNLLKNNMTGFTATPTGYFNGTTVMDDTSLALFWTADADANPGFPQNAHNAAIFNDYPLIHVASTVKAEGASLRCVMDWE